MQIRNEQEENGTDTAMRICVRFCTMKNANLHLAANIVITYNKWYIIAYNFAYKFIFKFIYNYGYFC